MLILDPQELSENERKLLDLIWRHGPVSRKDLAAIAGMTGASTTRLTKRALDWGLIEEVVARVGAVGNPSRPLSRAQSGIYSAGVSFTKERMSFALANMNFEVLEADELSVLDVTIGSLARFVSKQLKTSSVLNKPGSRLVGLGLAVPGYRAKSQGQWAVHWDFPHLLRSDLSTLLSREIDVPVFTERDAIAGAWAERLNGKGRAKANFCYLYLAQGVGGAVFSEGRPIMGAHGNASGFGSLFPYDAPRPSLVDLERYLAEQNLSIDGLDLNDQTYWQVVDGWIERVLPSFRRGLNLIARLHDPELIILGGALPRAIIDRLLIAADWSGVQADYTDDLPSPRLTVSDLSQGATLQGAAALPVVLSLLSSIR